MTDACSPDWLGPGKYAAFSAASKVLHTGLRASAIEDISTQFAHDLEAFLSDLVGRVEAAPGGVLVTSYQDAIGEMFCP